MRGLVISVLLGVLLAPVAARADAHELAAIPAVHEACGSVYERVQSRLYTLEVDPGWRFTAPREGQLLVDTRRNLHAMNGHVSILVSGLEPVGFEADAEAAASLRSAAGAGARLRVGFFLGFDDPSRQPCVVRNEHAVTIVRADLAFVELVSSADESIARAETDRLRAWTDDLAALSVPGEGPRGAVGTASFASGEAVPESWQRALAIPAARRHFARCHAAGLARGGSVEGQVIVRLNIETRTGRIRRADVALSSIGDHEASECVARAIGGGITLPPGPGSWQAEVVDLTVPVRLASD